jgi:hypothetical protein
MKAKAIYFIVFYCAAAHEKKCKQIFKKFRSNLNGKEIELQTHTHAHVYTNTRINDINLALYVCSL